MSTMSEKRTATMNSKYVTKQEFEDTMHAYNELVKALIDRLEQVEGTLARLQGKQVPHKNSK